MNVQAPVSDQCILGDWNGDGATDIACWAPLANTEERLGAGVWNAAVLLRELRERGYQGGYTILKDYLQPKREAARSIAVRRFDTRGGARDPSRGR